jgi:hypothetical protein
MPRKPSAAITGACPRRPLRCARRPDAANGKISRKAPDQRRNASVHGPTSVATKRPITTFVEKKSGTSATRMRSRCRALAQSMAEV